MQNIMGKTVQKEKKKNERRFSYMVRLSIKSYKLYLQRIRSTIIKYGQQNKYST